MSWLSKLMGEMPEETKYRSSQQFKVQTETGYNYTVSQDTENPESFEEGSPFKQLENQMLELNKSYSMNTEKNTELAKNFQQKASSLIFGVVIFMVFASLAFTGNSSLINVIIPLIVILALFKGIGKSVFQEIEKEINNNNSTKATFNPDWFKE